MVNPVHTEQPPPFTELNCKCGRFIAGVLAGAKLDFGPVQIVSAVRVRCMGCKWVTKWQPWKGVDPAKPDE